MEMQETFYIPPLVKRRRTFAQLKYRESAYLRSPLQRLTPFSWFLIILATVGLILVVGAFILRSQQAQYEIILLSDWLAQHGITSASRVANDAPMVTATTLPQQGALAIATPQTGTGSVQVTVIPTTPRAPAGQAPAIQATSPAQASASASARATLPAGLPQISIGPRPAVATANPYGAPWAPLLVRQRDNTLLAPQDVVSKAEADLSKYYAMQRDLSLSDYLTQRDQIMDTFFTGPALDNYIKVEISRTQYLENRTGKFTIYVRNFTPNGINAQAGVIKLGWVNDVYDFKTGQLIRARVTETDTLTVVSITYDQTSSRWKFVSVGDVGEINR